MRQCPECGAEVSGHGLKVYCSHLCRSRYAERKRQADFPRRSCETCGLMYKPYVDRQRFCPACRGRRFVGKPLTCPVCYTTFTQHKANQKYCSTSCREARRGWPTRPKPAHYRGSYHVRAMAVREAANRDPSTRCWRCGQLPFEHPLHKNGSYGKWTAGHVVDGQIDGVLLPEWSTCAVTSGARLGNARSRSRTTTTPARRSLAEMVEGQGPSQSLRRETA